MLIVVYYFLRCGSVLVKRAATKEAAVTNARMATFPPLAVLMEAAAAMAVRCYPHTSHLLVRTLKRLVLSPTCDESKPHRTCTKTRLLNIR